MECKDHNSTEIENNELILRRDLSISETKVDSESGMFIKLFV